MEWKVKQVGEVLQPTKLFEKISMITSIDKLVSIIQISL